MITLWLFLIWTGSLFQSLGAAASKLRIQHISVCKEARLGGFVGMIKITIHIGGLPHQNTKMLGVQGKKRSKLECRLHSCYLQRWANHLLSNTQTTTLQQFTQNLFILRAPLFNRNIFGNDYAFTMLSVRWKSYLRLKGHFWNYQATVLFHNL